MALWRAHLDNAVGSLARAPNREGRNLATGEDVQHVSMEVSRDMDRRSSPVYWVLVTLIAAAVVLIALRPGQTETVVLPPIDIPPPSEADPGEGTVVSRIRTGGNSIFGIEFGSWEHRLEVQFYAPEGCFEIADSEGRWPTSAPECATEIDITGEFGGGGIDATGASIITVLVTVSGDCYEATPRGATWPLTSPACERTST